MESETTRDGRVFRRLERASVWVCIETGEARVLADPREVEPPEWNGEPTDEQLATGLGHDCDAAGCGQSHVVVVGRIAGRTTSDKATGADASDAKAGASGAANTTAPVASSTYELPEGAEDKSDIMPSHMLAYIDGPGHADVEVFAPEEDEREPTVRVELSAPVSAVVYALARAGLLPTLSPDTEARTIAAVVAWLGSCCEDELAAQVEAGAWRQHCSKEPTP